MSKEVKRIFLIDDDPINNMINLKLFSKFSEDLEIVTFQKAKEALSYLSSTDASLPDIIFLDINMPEMNGWDFLEQVKSLDIQLTILMLTSSIDKNDIQKSTEYPVVQDYLIKPLNLEKIKEVFLKHDLAN